MRVADQSERKGNQLSSKALTPAAPAEVAERDSLTIERAAKLLKAQERINAFDLPMIKLPLTGSQVFSNGKSEVEGVALHVQPRRVFWGDQPVSSNSSPLCSSFDGNTGASFFEEDDLAAAHERYGPFGGECRECPMAMWGSDDRSERGQACRQAQFLYLMTSRRSVVPTILRIPSTSIRNFDKYKTAAMADGYGLWEVKTIIRLSNRQNRGGIDYNVLTFEFEALTQADMAFYAQLGDILTPKLVSEQHLRSQAALISPISNQTIVAADAAPTEEVPY